MTENQPSLNKEAFYCPRCGVLCPHKHFAIERTRADSEFDINIMEINSDQKKFIEKGSGFVVGEGRVPWDLYITLCTHCNEYAIWENQNIIFPDTTTIDKASSDMPKEVKSIYEEARLVYKNSPRAAAALLRLAIETLIPKLDYEIKEDRLFDMIGELVEKNIPNYIQRGLDSLRYYGNKGIHTAEIDMEDDRESVIFLFRLCNIIVEELISKKKEINEFYEMLPKRFRLSIEERDKARS